MKMVRMVHDDPVATGGPTTADVPDDGVPMMRSVGWYLENEKEEHTTKRKRAESQKEM
jgi:hypothetical protein